MRVSDARGSQAMQLGCVAGKQPHIGSRLLIELREDLREAVEVGLAADEAGSRVRFRFGEQMLAAAETDLQPHRS